MHTRKEGKLFFKHPFHQFSQPYRRLGKIKASHITALPLQALPQERKLIFSVQRHIDCDQGKRWRWGVNEGRQFFGNVNRDQHQTAST
ncbi:unnamed protein product [Linum tenue]|uniref:Uncharacterized protein n=1 Tax=Linum tenue TaxID=586396 RepID=A0AAV0LBZ4_9ROSI|nr:unnamed protein product [Linum tenue]